LLVTDADGRKYGLSVLAVLADDQVSATEVFEIVREGAKRAEDRVGIPTCLKFNALDLHDACMKQILDADRQLTGENAGRIQARVVAEGANGPTSVEADAILGERGILVLPDVLTNAGGVTVSYFEWVQDIGRLFWDRNEIRAKLADKLADAFERVWRLAVEQGLSLRSAALVAGIREVGAALTSRGIYP